MTEINPIKLFKQHDNCADGNPHCFCCQPKDEVAFIMTVGVRYYPTHEDFNREAMTQGISKRIPFQSLPKHMELGKTIIYLAHPKACEVKEPVAALQQAMEILEAAQPRLMEADKTKRALGIFSAFIPQRLEKIFWESQKTDKLLKDCEKKGISPVFFKDGDKDHE